MLILNVDPPKQFAPLFDNIQRTIIEDSGRSSGKSTTNEEAAALFMLQSKYNNVWYCRAETNDLRKTVLSSMWSTIQSMGLEGQFTLSLSPIRIYCKSGAVCYFDGINGKTDDDLNATKGFTPNHKSLKMAILDEANDTKCKAHITAWETTADKFLIEGSKKVIAYNPPPLKTHYIHEYRKQKLSSGATRIYTTWKDIYNLLKPATIAEIKRMRDTDPLFYRYWYLGECINFSGMVYPQFKRERHCVKLSELLKTGDRITELIIGLDEGTVNDSTCATPLAVMMSGKAVVLDCYEYSPTDRNSHQGFAGQMSPSEASRALWKWLQSLFVRFAWAGVAGVPRQWIFESAEGGQMLRNQFVSDYGEKTCLVENKSIWGDIKRVRNMLGEDILFFNVEGETNTEVLMQDIESYVIDEKTNDVKKNQREDTIDSLEYATKLYYDRPLRVYGGGF